MRCFLGHDLGTSGVKTVLALADGTVLAHAEAAYPLERPARGWAEQDPEDWWRAVVRTTRAVLAEAGVSAESVAAVAHAGQMLALVALARDGTPTRKAVSWLDARAEAQATRLVRRFGGERVLHVLAGGSPTAKDLVAKIAWIADEEPAVFARTAAFTDATGFLVARSTGMLAIDPTAASCTGMFDVKSRSWATLLSKLAGFPLDKMPRVVRSTDRVGGLVAAAATELGLLPGTPVVMGMADIPAAAVGAGAIRPGEAHVYLGTSSWIGVSLGSAKQLPSAGLASVASATDAGFLLIGESETAGACREWVRTRLGLGDAELEALVEAGTPGAGGLLFLPWLYGERSPLPDAALRGGFVGLSLDHDRGELVRAVYEGVAANLRWTLDACGEVGERCPTLRALGGGARSDPWMQILADVTGRPIERVTHPRLAGALGAALVAAVGARDLPDVESIAARVRVDRTFRPRFEHRETYARSYRAFRQLAPAMARASRTLGGVD